MSVILYSLVHLLARAVHSDLVRENQFLKVENQIMRAKLGRRISLSVEERNRLIRFGRELGASISEVISIVKPTTFLRWLKGGSDLGQRPQGRPPKGRDTRQLILRMGRENPGWGYQRISGELRKLDIRCSGNTVKKYLIEAGLAPRPNRRKSTESTWNEFLKQHAETIVACDFFTKPVWTLFGRVTCYVLFFIHLGSRRVWISPCTPNPDARWVEQQARNFSMAAEDIGIGFNYFIHDRDQKFTDKFRAILSDDETRYVQIPRRAPDCNAYAESFVASLKRECLDHFICFGLEHLDHICFEYVHWYGSVRPHQGKGNRTLTRLRQGSANGEVVCESRLGGLLRHYYRSAA